MVGGEEENVERIIPEWEESPPQPRAVPGPSSRLQPVPLSVITNALRVYADLVRRFKNLPKSPCCPHTHGCLHYALKVWHGFLLLNSVDFFILQGGVKMLAVGYAVQVLLRTVLSLGKVSRRPSLLFKYLVAKDVLDLGAFLGLFSTTFRVSVRHFQDSPPP